MDIEDERLVFVQLLLYDRDMKAPSPETGRAWAEHFGMDRSKNHVVLVGEENLLGSASYDMIPGFHLIDKNFILRVDATGSRQKDIWTALLPKVRTLLEE